MSDDARYGGGWITVSLQSLIQEAASVANVFSVLVLAVGYYFMVKLYREWVHMSRESRAAGGRPQADAVVRNFTKAPAKEVAFEFSAPVESPEGTVLYELPYFEKGLPFLEPDGKIGRPWGSLPDLASMLREKGIEDGIRVKTSYKDLAGESYESEWTLNPLLFEGSGIENSRSMTDLVDVVEKISGTLRSGPAERDVLEDHKTKG
jgi:hypothetical protein